MPADPMLSRAEAAAKLDIKPSTLSGYVTRGQAPPPDTRPGDPGHPRWRESTIVGWTRIGQGKRPQVATPEIGGVGRHLLTQHAHHATVTDDPPEVRRILTNLAFYNQRPDYSYIPDVTCLHVHQPKGGWGPGWQWWSDGVLTVGSWHGVHHQSLPCEAALTIVAFAENRRELPDELIATLATATAVTSTQLRQIEHTVRGWTREVTLRHHHVRCETSPDADGAFREYGLDLWAVDISAGGFNGEDGDEYESHFLYADENWATARFVASTQNETTLRREPRR